MKKKKAAGVTGADLEGTAWSPVHQEETLELRTTELGYLQPYLTAGAPVPP